MAPEVLVLFADAPSRARRSFRTHQRPLAEYVQRATSIASALSGQARAPRALLAFLKEARDDSLLIGAEDRPAGLELTAQRLASLSTVVVVSAGVDPLPESVFDVLASSPALRLAVLYVENSSAGAVKLWRGMQQGSGRRSLGVLFWKGNANVPYTLLDAEHDFVLTFLSHVDQALSDSPESLVAPDAAASSGRGTALREVFARAQTAFEDVLKCSDADGVWERQHYFEEPDHPQFEEFVCVGAPELLCWEPDAERARALTGQFSGLSFPTARMSRHLELYRVHLRRAAVELKKRMAGFASKAEDFRLKGEAAYWKLTTLYQVGSLLGWLHHIDTFFVGASLRAIRQSFCPEELSAELEELLGPPGVLRSAGVAMTNEWRVPPGILPYIKFKRRMELSLPAHHAFRSHLVPVVEWYDRNEANGAMHAELLGVAEKIARCSALEHEA